VGGLRPHDPIDDQVVVVLGALDDREGAHALGISDDDLDSLLSGRAAKATSAGDPAAASPLQLASDEEVLAEVARRFARAAGAPAAKGSAPVPLRSVGAATHHPVADDEIELDLDDDVAARTQRGPTRGEQVQHLEE
jgi:hypothetical protein